MCVRNEKGLVLLGGKEGSSGQEAKAFGQGLCFLSSELLPFSHCSLSPPVLRQTLQC